MSTPPSIDIIYEDNHLLGIVKPGGLLVQGDRTGDPTALELAKAYVKAAYGKPGQVYLGLVHRIDRPVSGVVVFARTSKAASRLTEQFRRGDVEKTYVAVVVGTAPRDEDTLEGWVERVHTRSRLAIDDSGGAKAAKLTYRVLSVRGGYSLLSITPHTGRHHQIRLQLASEGIPIVGDMKYGAREPLPDRTIALHAMRLCVRHPVREETVTLASSPPPTDPWRLFGDLLRETS